jgi:hypothetical protein
MASSIATKREKEEKKGSGPIYLDWAASTLPIPGLWIGSINHLFVNSGKYQRLQTEPILDLSYC